MENNEQKYFLPLEKPVTIVLLTLDVVYWSDCSVYRSHCQLQRTCPVESVLPWNCCCIRRNVDGGPPHSALEVLLPPITNALCILQPHRTSHVRSKSSPSRDCIWFKIVVEVIQSVPKGPVGAYIKNISHLSVRSSTLSFLYIYKNMWLSKNRSKYIYN